MLAPLQGADHGLHGWSADRRCGRANGPSRRARQHRAGKRLQRLAVPWLVPALPRHVRRARSARLRGLRRSAQPCSSQTDTPCSPRSARTVVADGFFYAPVDNITAAWAAAPQIGCAGTAGVTHYPTAFDGMEAMYCVAPHAPCRSGSDVVRCKHSGGHYWPYTIAMLAGEWHYANLVFGEDCLLFRSPCPCHCALLGHAPRQDARTQAVFRCRADFAFSHPKPV